MTNRDEYWQAKTPAIIQTLFENRELCDDILGKLNYTIQFDEFDEDAPGRAAYFAALNDLNRRIAAMDPSLDGYAIHHIAQLFVRRLRAR
jgi:hypothetical protein